MRRKLVAGNWKMHGLWPALSELDRVESALDDISDVDVVICPPYTLIAAAAQRSRAVLVGAQDCHSVREGAYTGSVSAPMLRDAGAQLVIVGHSERRVLAGDTDADVRSKAAASIAAGLHAIICVGEHLTDRKEGRAISVVERQLEACVPPFLTDSHVTIAYEPVWAIGTGSVPTVAQVEEMHGAIRTRLRKLLGPAGCDVRLLYGGSVKSDNAAKLMALENVDGVLVGGASLNASRFLPIIAAASRVGEAARPA